MDSGIHPVVNLGLRSMKGDLLYGVLSVHLFSLPCYGELHCTATGFNDGPRLSVDSWDSTAFEFMDNKVQFPLRRHLFLQNVLTDTHNCLRDQKLLTKLVGNVGGCGSPDLANKQLPIGHANSPIHPTHQQGIKT
jgi:hypothetical protein